MSPELGNVSGLRGVRMLLAPGAGAGRDQATLVAIDIAATAAGAMVERMDFAYRKAGRRAPDREPVLLESVREEVARLAAVPDSRAREPAGPPVEGASGSGHVLLTLGGRSMGGRICSMVAAELGQGPGGPAGPGGQDAPRAVALVLISYPLHPPGRPDRLRTAHFGRIQGPCLFVSGTRDAFGTPAEIELATAAIPGPVTHVWLDGRDHGLRGCDERVAGAVVAWLETRSSERIGLTRTGP